MNQEKYGKETMDTRADITEKYKNKARIVSHVKACSQRTLKGQTRSSVPKGWSHRRRRRQPLASPRQSVTPTCSQSRKSAHRQSRQSVQSVTRGACTLKVQTRSPVPKDGLTDEESATSRITRAVSHAMRAVSHARSVHDSHRKVIDIIK